MDATLSVYVVYDDGFHNAEHLDSCFVYVPANRTWEPRCMSVNDINLSNVPATSE